MEPKAIQTGLVVDRDGEDLVLRAAAGDEVARLDAVSYAVFELADGYRGVEEIAGLVAARFPDQLVDAETVWSAYDLLRSYGLIEGWNAPPADSGRVTRRQALGFARAAALAAAIVPVAGSAFAQTPPKPPGPPNEAVAKRQLQMQKKPQQEAAHKKAEALQKNKNTHKAGVKNKAEQSVKNSLKGKTNQEAAAKRRQEVQMKVKKP